MKSRPVPVPSVRRLPRYLHFLQGQKVVNRSVISCTHIAKELKLDPTQIRKDLAITGYRGKPRVGYNIDELINAIQVFLGWNNMTDSILVGAGHLGTALLGYTGYNDMGIKIIMAFDDDPEKQGQKIHNREIFAMDRLPDLVQRLHIHIGILTVPADAAQSTANLLIQSGINAIWNFTPAYLNVPEPVIVEHANLRASLAALSSRLKKLTAKQD